MAEHQPGEPETPSDPAAAVLVRALGRAHERLADGAWSEERDAELDRFFEQAAVAALAVPALVERSALLRRVGRRVVPIALRPLARRMAGRLDTARAPLVMRLRALRAGR